MARRKTGTRRADTPAQAPLRPAMGQAAVRMYRQGLGDCFLVRMPRRDGGEYAIMIDCGVILGTADAVARMRAVVADIIATTGGFVDLLIVTHEHWDHVSGFSQAEGLFAREGEAAAGRLRVGSVWCAWTEDPRDPLATALQGGLAGLMARVTEKALALQALAAAPAADAATRARLEEVAGLLAFFGIEPGEVVAGMGAGGMSRTRAALDAAKGLAPVSYQRPGEPATFLRDCDARLYVLGPPRDLALLRKTEPAREGYRLADLGLAEAPPGAGAWPEAPLFDERFSLPLPAAPLPETLPEDDPYRFLWTHYLADRAREARILSGGMAEAGVAATPAPSRPGERVMREVLVRQDWRRLDAEDPSDCGELALQLDGATNNTSLVLALELGAGGPVLLFVGDAQAGNWLGWDSLPGWKVEGRKVGVDDLLARTVFYKVGHHGSHNATLKGRGLERMTDGNLVAFVPVDRPMARRKRWDRMPLPAIVEALRERTGGRTVLSETAPPAGEPPVPFAFRDGFASDGEGGLWYEVIVPAAR